MPIIRGMEHDSDSGWTTYYRVPHPVLGTLLIQKRDGCTRTVPASIPWRRREIALVDQLLGADLLSVHTDHDLVAMQAA